MRPDYKWEMTLSEVTMRRKRIKKIDYGRVRFALGEIKFLLRRENEEDVRLDLYTAASALNKILFK